MITSETVTVTTYTLTIDSETAEALAALVGRATGDTLFTVYQEMCRAGIDVDSHRVDVNGFVNGHITPIDSSSFTVVKRTTRDF